MRVLLSALPLLALSACGSGDAPVTGEAGKTTIKMEAGCTLGGLTPALRETLIVIDKTMVKPASPEAFRVENAALWGLVIGLSEGQRAADTGAMAPRERLTIAVADPATGGLDQLFTGCIPGLSKDETTKRAGTGEDGLSSKFMGSDMAAQITRQREEFMKQVVVTLATAKFGGEPKRGDSFADSGFARTMKTIGPGRGTADTVRRVFLFADPAAAMTDVSQEHVAARKQGFALAETLQANFGQ